MDRWDKADLSAYYMCSGQLLQSIHVSVELDNCSSYCDYMEHKSKIDLFYNDIVAALKLASTSTVPRLPANCLKPYWTEK